MNFKNLLFFSLILMSNNVFGTSSDYSHEMKAKIKSQFKDSEYKKKIELALQSIEKQSGEKIDIKDLENIVIEQHKNSNKFYGYVKIGIFTAGGAVAGMCIGWCVALAKLFGN